MADRIASAEIHVGVTGDVDAELRKIEAEFKRAMSKIDHQKAQADIGADLAPLEDAVARARRLLKKYEGQRATAQLSADKKQLDRQIKAARTSIKRLDGEKATVELKLKGKEKILAAQRELQLAAEKRELAEQRAAEKTASVKQKALRDTTRAEEAAARENLRRVNNEARVASALNKQRIREMRSAESEARRIDEDQDTRALRLANAQIKYAKAVRAHEKQQFRKTPLGREARVELKLDQARAYEEMLSAKRKLNALGGHPPVEIKVDIDRKDRLGQWFLGIIDKMRNLGSAGQGLRASIGPISGTLTTLSSAALVLAPVLVALAGALGALIAVAASAVAGLGALTLGFVGGLVPAVLGAIFVLKPIVKRLGDVKKAQQAYNKAVDQYGEGSKQANAAHHKMAILLGHVDKSTIKAFESAGNLSKRWRELTKPSQAVAFNVIGQALHTASADLDVFARGTNRVFGAAGRAIQGWLKGLRSSEAKSILGNLMGNFAKTVGPLASGLGHIFTWLGRIASVASNFLPGIAEGFSSWAKGIADAAKNTPGVEKTLRRMVKSLSSVGRLFVSTGKFLAAFFDGGVDSGQNLADTLSDTLDKWTAFLKSTKGKKELKQFFTDAVNDTKKITGIIADLSTAFYQVAKAVEPIIKPLSDVWNLLVKILTWRTPDWGIQAQKDAIQGVADAFTWLWTAAQNAGRFLANMATTVVAAMTRVHDTVNSVARGIGSIASKAVKIGVNFASGGLDKAKSAINTLVGGGGKVVKIATQVATGAVSKAIGLVNSLLSLGGSVVRIGAAFASGVISHGIGVVHTLLGLGGSAVRIGASFASGVIGHAIALVGRLLAFAGRVVHVGTSVGLGPVNAALNAVRALLSFAGKIVNIGVHVSIPKIPSLKSLIPHASGTGPSRAHSALVGEGRGPEILANQKTGDMRIVRSPTILGLGPDDYVIPTEAKHKSRGAQLMEQFARAAGIPSFARGKKAKNPPLSEHGKQVARSHANASLKHKEIRNPGAYTEINAVKSLQDSEAEQRARIDIAESKLKEPDTFLVKVGEDSEGNDVMAVDQAKVSAWTAQLNAMRDMYNKLIATMVQLQTAVKKAITAVTTSITTANTNLGRIKKLEDIEHARIGKKGASKAAVQGAKERLKVYGNEADRQRKIRQDAQDSKADLAEENKYTGIQYRIDQATVARDEYQSDADATAGRAADAQASSVQKVTPAAFDPFAAGGAQADALAAEAALTAIGQGTRSPQDIIAAQIANQQGIINIAKGLLGDSDPNNDQAANQAITGAAGAIAGFQGSLPNIGQEQRALGSARSDLFQNMGSNFAMAGAFGRLSGAGGGFGAFGANPAAVGFAGGQAGGPTIVNLNNTFPTPPADPHIWSQGVKYELQAAL